MRLLHIDHDHIGQHTLLDLTQLVATTNRLCATNRRHSQQLVGRNHARIAHIDLLQERRTAHLLPHIEVVVRAGTVGCDRHVHALVEQLRHGRDTARNLHIALRVMCHRHTALAQYTAVVIAQMDAVSSNRALAQKSVTINQFDGRATKAFLNLALLVVRFGQVNRNWQVVLLAQLRSTAHIRLRTAIRRVRSDHHRQAVALLGLSHRCGQIHLEGLHTRIDKAGREHRADTQFLGRISHRLLVPIHIDERGHATAQHLDNTQLGTELHIVAVDQRLIGPDVVVQPLHQLDIVGIATHQCHRDVAMGVDQTRHQQSTTTVHLAQITTALLAKTSHISLVACDHHYSITAHTNRRLEILLRVGQ